jgi:hypothetical protein
MEPTRESLIMELVRMINQIHGRHMNRLRIAVTQSELDQIKQEASSYPSLYPGTFVHAIRGLPLQIEPDPMHPVIILEAIEGV